MESAAYRKLLVRLLALPIIALALLAFILVYGFRQVERGARRVDRADQVIAHANNLIKLIVDEETGLRGFMITHDPAFLQPYQEATKQSDPEFATLYGLVKNSPEQTARLQSMQAATSLWQQSAGSTIAAPALAPELTPWMREREQRIDAVRATAGEFLSAETRIRAYSFRAAQARIRLHVDIKTEEKAWGNAGEFRQVISNLFANSLDACQAADAVCVRVRAAHSRRDLTLEGIRISVADTGCGIGSENLGRIFEPFFTTKKDTGTGLGLWVSRELIEKHSGYLEVRSVTTGRRTGTVFTMFLPGSAVVEEKRDLQSA